MYTTIERFIRLFSDAIRQGDAAIFAGAGLSCSSGYVDWKELLRDFANDIRLNVDIETDLISVAQYYKNEMGGNRNDLNQTILCQFTKSVSENKSMSILASLPIDTYWTTNYDHIIEDSLRKENKNIDVKVSQESLAINLSNRDAVVYKFHGDISDPSKAILTKDDFELFDNSHKLFITSLQGDLITKTFVFVGYSLCDPNILHILSKMRILLGENQRSHFYLLKRININDYTDSNKYKYDCIKQDHVIKDLKRYGIRAVLIDDYSEIPNIFERIKKHYYTSSVFVAGSCRNYGNWSSEQAYQFLYSLGYKLIENRYKVSTGLIEGVGPQLVNGVLTAINDYHLNIEKYLSIKTLPLINGKSEHMSEESKKLFQHNMISQAGIILFIFGNQYYNGELSISKGVLEDYERALAQNKYIIPVGSTGFASEKILNEIETNIENYKYLKLYINDLKEERDPLKLIDVVINVIKSIRDIN